MTVARCAGSARWTRAAATVLALAAAAGCDDGSSSTSPSTTTGTDGAARLVSEFENGSDGWAVDVSDFSDATRPEDLLSETGVAPPGLDERTGFVHVAATNRSDDLFLYLARRIGSEVDLAPNTSYTVEFEVTAASNSPSGCAGIGGAPGESVWLKVGATTEQPVPIDEDGQTRLSVDKGNQSGGGADADVAGVVANGIPCEEALDSDRPYAMVSWSHTFDGTVTTDADGELWAFVGTDSGFEGRTDLYYDSIELVLTPAS